MDSFSTVFLPLCLWMIVILLHQQKVGCQQGEKANNPFMNGLCTLKQFRCLDEGCIERVNWCDGINHCRDNSDERFCKNMYNYNCPTGPYPFFKCADRSRCIPLIWKCNKMVDCVDGSDEVNCPNILEKVPGAFESGARAAKWFLNQRKANKTMEKWGSQVARIAVALYIADEKFFAPGNKTGEEITYELSIRLQSVLMRDETGMLLPNELALYVHAILITCLDPRNFQGVNLVEILRELVDSQNNYTNPFVLLTLCNAGDTMTGTDVKKLASVIETPYRPFWTDTRALALMALSCIANQSESSVDQKILTKLASQLKLLQHRNGVIQTLPTTALVTQALFAAGKENDKDWNMEDSIMYLMLSQSSDGSFESILNTYYVLPVLMSKSLVNVSSQHCKPLVDDDETTALDDLRNQMGTKIHIIYSLWYGDFKDLARTLEIRIVENSTFFDVMKLAATLDFRYRFKYTKLNEKPYVDVLSGIQNDPENDAYWFLYIRNRFGTTEVDYNLSPIDFVPKNNDECIMWYRTGDWNLENLNSDVSKNDTGRLAPKLLQ